MDEFRCLLETNSCSVYLDVTSDVMFSFDRNELPRSFLLQSELKLKYNSELVKDIERGICYLKC